MSKVWKFVENYGAKVFGEEKSKNIVKHLKAGWHGEASLFKVFWIYGAAVTASLFVFFITPMTIAGGRLGLSVALILLAPYYVWILGSIWSCAENIELEEFKGIPRVYLTWAAKGVSLFGSLYFFLALFG